ncbi:F510_1955 family glycosylhydrolase [Mesobacillus jeotgali]|uniref:F510_1955 family glycosylhydrolase n=1 Tax=Mesobacillus jeotgali TaxID=129985 RepID=UPI0009A62030|nr:hypothetical protein [Mesobacillus jeotgali]
MKNRIIFLAAAMAFIMMIFAGCTGTEEKQEPAQKQESTEKQQSTDKNITSDISEEEFIKKASSQKIDHVHGLGYPGNDKGLYIATHNGLKMFINGEWLETAGQNHDYMGFQATADGFYASGHPEKGSDLKNPLGIVKSTDKGKTLEKIAFYGESDFHFLSVGYKEKVVYLINEEPNSELERGVYQSKDQARSWETVKMNGLEASTLGMMAVHPENGGTFAMATKEGIFMTDDYGENMRKSGEFEMVTAAAFSKDALFISPVQEQKIKMFKLNPSQEGTAEELSIPHLNHDNPITYIAADPNQEGRIAFMTILNDLYESEDGGKTWKQLLVNGKIEQ